MRSHGDLIAFEKHRITEGQLGSSVGRGRNGAFSFRQGKVNFFIVISDEEDWEHVSVTVNGGKRTPTWEQMCWIKDKFWKPDELVIQFHPRESEYVSFHPHCLHLWKPIGVELPTPPPYMVGPDGPEVYKVQRPLMTNAPDGMAGLLIYNESRAIEFLTQDNEELREAMGEREKVYVHAEIGAAPNRFWLINPKIVEDEDW